MSGGRRRSARLAVKKEEQDRVAEQRRVALKELVAERDRRRGKNVEIIELYSM